MVMKNISRKMLGGCLGFLLIANGKLRRVLSDLNETNSVVCAYGHNPTKESFERIVLWLMKHDFQFISDCELINLLKNGTLDDANYIWFSFDDGYKENIWNVLPVLDKYKIPATIFITTKAIERGWFWFDVVLEYQDLLPICSIDKLFDMPNAMRRSIIDDLVNSKEFKPKVTAMTIDDIQSISENELISIQNHTDDHVISTSCTADEFTKEITECSRKIKDWTGKTSQILSYPCGRYNKQTIEIAKKTGMQIAVTIEGNIFKLEGGKISMFEIPRTYFTNFGTLSEHLCQIFGIWWGPIKNIKKIVRKK